MATDPNALPESIITGSFKGVRNTVSRERLGPDDLVSAVNVDLDDAGQARRRRGQTLLDEASYHSVKEIGGRVLGVKDTIFGTINPDFSFLPLRMGALGMDPLSYAQVGDTTYIASRAHSIKLTGDTTTDWGATGGDGRWISPVKTPMETLGEVFGRYIHAPPMAEHIAAYSGRIYLLAGRYVWATELYLYDYVDRSKNFLPLEYDGTMICAAGDGIYVGTTGGLYFAKGVLSKGFRLDKISDDAVIPGSLVEGVPISDVHPNARNQPMPEGTAAVFMTTGGICAAFDGGTVYNLTRGRVVFPEASNAAALYRDDRGVSSYVAVADSGGSPQANARIGDFVDAEIIRAADRLGG